MILITSHDPTSWVYSLHQFCISGHRAYNINSLYADVCVRAYLCVCILLRARACMFAYVCLHVCLRACERASLNACVLHAWEYHPSLQSLRYLGKQAVVIYLM